MVAAESQVTLANKPYKPLGAAKEMIHSAAPEILLEGPAGTGKTRAVLEKANLICLLHQDARVLLVRKTRKSLNETVLEILETHVLPDWPDVNTHTNRSSRESYSYPNGSKLILGGLDKDNVNRIMSGEFDMVCLFEATEATEDDWQKLLTRLRNKRVAYQQGIADCNPAHPKHWLNVRAQHGKMERIKARFDDNPMCDAEYRNRLEGLTGVVKERLYHGRWVAAEGVIWPEYDARVHLIDSFDIPKDWRRFRSIDFGYTNPFVCQWWAADEDGRLYLYREIYMSHRTVAQHGAQIIEHSKGERIDATIADHDAEDRATLHEMGIATTKAQKDVPTGIQAVARRLQKAGDGRPRIFFMRDSLVERDPRLVDEHQPLCTTDEIDTYIWKPSADGANPKEEPDKQRCADHGCDAARYMVKHLDRGGGPVVQPLDGPTEREARTWSHEERKEQREAVLAARYGIATERRSDDEWLSVDNDQVFE